MPSSIRYRDLEKYKYQLMKDYSHDTGLRLPAAVATSGRWVAMSKTGRLALKKGYSWDGPSGPTIDTPDFMRGALVHDALYQLMRERLLPSRLRRFADELLRDMCRADGMSKLRSEYVYSAVRAFGAKSARPGRRTAPKLQKAPR